MTFKNTTALEDKALRGMVSHAVRCWRRDLVWRKNNKWRKPFRVADINAVEIRNRKFGTSGHAWGSPCWRIVVSVGLRGWHCREGCGPRWKDCGERSHVIWTPSTLAERISSAAHLIAHEVGHLAVHWAEDFHGRKWTRQNGKSSGGDEEFIDRMALQYRDEWLALQG
tara:strand:+ start:535 stop:1038 length:504 start_codon:yes stop_codon:yes gene_type:complete